MRILHVTPYFEDAWAYGGIPRAAAVIVRSLAARAHHVTVCTTDAYLPNRRLPGANAERTARRNSNITVQVFRNVSNAAAYHLQFFAPFGLGRFLRAHAHEFDVAHLHGCHHLPGAIAARHLKRAAVPYAITPNGTAPYIERRRFAKRLFDVTLGRGVLEGASRVIAVSHAERRQLVAFGVPDSNIDVVPNPIDVAEFVPTVPGAFRRRFGIDLAAPLVLYLGKLTPRKRLDTLVEAFARLDAPQARLAIAGNDMGFLRQLRACIERLGVGDRTIITGLLPGSERLCALGDADVVAYATEDEVFGIVPVEALLCGTPVVVANDSGCGEVVTHTGGGLIVPPGDPAALAAALDRILGDRRQWRRAAALARPRALDYSGDAVCTPLEQIYGELVASSIRQQAVAV
jgi:glycosyltransferase involved in cell wall biosynthesis